MQKNLIKDEAKDIFTQTLGKVQKLKGMVIAYHNQNEESAKEISAIVNDGDVQLVTKWVVDGVEEHKGSTPTKEEIMALISEISESWNDLSSIGVQFAEVEDFSEQLDENYPFKQSFDEISLIS